MILDGPNFVSAGASSDVPGWAGPGSKAWAWAYQNVKPSPHSGLGPGLPVGLGLGFGYYAGLVFLVAFSHPHDSLTQFMYSLWTSGYSGITVSTK